MPARTLMWVAVACLMAAPLAAVGPAAAASARIDPAVFQAIDRSPTRAAGFIVMLRERAALDAAGQAAGRGARKAAVVSALRESARRSQAPLLTDLQQMQSAGMVVRFRSFFSVNAVGVVGTRQAVSVLAAHPAVAAVLPDAVVTLDLPRAGSVEPRVGTVEWNIDKIRAPRVWSRLGITGAGTVVANIDTGVRHTHEALIGHYNCPPAGPHTNCWLDAVAGQPAPYDDNVGIWHGTHTMGTSVGGDGPGPLANDVGVAWGAKWIACKAFNAAGSALSTDILECSDFLLAPGGDPAKAPDVINNSWGSSSGSSEFYRPMLQGWRAAGIFPAFSIGNAGPACGTARVPGALPEAFGTGATDISDNIADFSSRGPSFFGEVKPEASAPGENVRSSIGLSDSSYGSLSGTSMAAPHVTGLVALLLDKNPGLNITSLENLAKKKSTKRVDLTCGGDGDGRPNNVYGWGRIDAFRAVRGAPAP